MPFFNRITSVNVNSYLKSYWKPTLSLRGYLILLVVGTLFPIIAFAGTVVYELSQREQEAANRRLLLATRNLASTVEREFLGTIRTLEALGASEHLSKGDLKAFHSEATRVVQTQSTWITVILVSPEGQQLVNTIDSFGRRLPRVSEPESLQRVVRTNQRTVGDLTPSKLRPNLTGIPVRIPVMQDYKLRYVLTAIIDQRAVARLVNEQASIDGEWTRTIVDGRGIVVARTRNPERFVGQRGTPSFLKRIGEATEGVYQETTLEGVKVLIAFRRVSGTPWTAAVTVPLEVIQAPARQALWLVVESGLILLFISGVGAFILSRQLSHSIHSAAAAAEALARGETFPAISPPIKEVVLLGESLELASHLLSQREQERNENLRQAEAAREEAEAANRIKDEFLAVLSHELRSPLNPILGWVRLIQSGRLDEAQTVQALSTIERNAKLQAELIEDLLDVSRILQGKLSLNIKSVYLQPIIKSAIETVRLSADAKSIRVEASIDLDVSPVLGDSTRLQQIVWNLLSNAIKFTPTGGWVKVCLQQVDNQAQIRVQDNGKGIPKDFLPYIFDYFRQADSSSTRKFGGLGLGLAIVRHLVELHGGTVQADSPGEEEGAIFTVKIPAIPTPTPIDSEISDLELFPSLQGVQALVVDDEADSREFVVFLLEQAGAKVTSVSSAAAALSVLRQTAIDILLSDIGMPEMDGYMLIQQVRALAPEQGGQIPAIALTAYAGEIDYQQAMSAGFQRHLTKPVESAKLLRAIANLVKQA